MRDARVRGHRRGFPHSLLQCRQCRTRGRDLAPNMQVGCGSTDPPGPRPHRSPASRASPWRRPRASSSSSPWHCPTRAPPSSCRGTSVGTSLLARFHLPIPPAPLRPSRPCAPVPHAHSSPAYVNTSVCSSPQSTVRTLDPANTSSAPTSVGTSLQSAYRVAFRPQVHACPAAVTAIV